MITKKELRSGDYVCLYQYCPNTIIQLQNTALNKVVCRELVFTKVIKEGKLIYFDIIDQYIFPTDMRKYLGKHVSIGSDWVGDKKDEFRIIYRTRSKKEFFKKCMKYLI